MKPASILILFLLVFITGCTDSPVMKKLQFAETIMEEQPDSAMQILQAIDGNKLIGEEQAWVNFHLKNYGTALENALFAYDLAMALDDVQNLSSLEFLIAMIYALGNNDAEAYRWDLLSLNHTKQCSGKQDRLINSYEYIAQDLLRMMWPKKAIQYADSALALSHEPSQVQTAIV